DTEKHLIPIYIDQSNDLLTRCLDEHTRNANGNLNSTIWRLAHLNCGAKILEIAAFIATDSFNKGHSAVFMTAKSRLAQIARNEFNEEAEGLLCPLKRRLDSEHCSSRTTIFLYRKF
ncbi:hypothetical protein ALC60_01149, partial [Trachymyrmex zeteki]